VEVATIRAGNGKVRELVATDDDIEPLSAFRQSKTAGSTRAPAELGLTDSPS
jgi:hypothetical protein